MISVIISCYRQKYINALEQNVDDTIGVEYEIIKIDNPGIMGICEAYNRGSQKAKYDILCFAHEDIEFKTKEWGVEVLKIFNNNNEIGLLGVAGNVYKTLSPSHWSFPTANSNSFFVNVLHPDSSDDDKSSTHFFSNPKNTALQYVAAIDGLWFCVPKKVVKEFRFDESRLKGFHGYDVDYSITVQQKYRVAVTFEILIKHFSTGSFKRAWIDEIIEVHKKWKNKLPLLVEGFAGFNQHEEEKKAIIFFMKKMVDNDYSFPEILKVLRLHNKTYRLPIKVSLYVFRNIVCYKYFSKTTNTQT